MKDGKQANVTEITCSRVNSILEFWFGRRNSPHYGKPRTIWFDKNPAFDRHIEIHFKAGYKLAASNQLDHWEVSYESCLALIILLDQFPRNMFRGHPCSYATDQKALSIAEYAVNKGLDGKLLPIQRWFMYMPFQHSEELEHQRRSVELFYQLEEFQYNSGAISSAVDHQEVIKHFGRFPHRNKILGRSSTPDELKFLESPYA